MRKWIVDLCNKQWFQKALEWFVNAGVSKVFIPLYASRFGVKKEELTKDLGSFSSLQEFFTRPISLDLRPLGDGPYVSPCDGYISEAGPMDDGRGFYVKDRRVNVKSLTGGEQSYEAFQVLYLAPGDYHRFHGIDTNAFSSVHSIGTHSLPVNDWGFRLGNPFLENYRVIMDTDQYTYVAVGAVNVNSIVIKKTSFEKGEEIGHFAMGSTIVLLYKQDPGPLKLGPIRARENLCQG